MHFRTSRCDVIDYPSVKGTSLTYRGHVALQYAKIGSSVNSSTGLWAPTGEERAVVPATLPATGNASSGNLTTCNLPTTNPPVAEKLDGRGNRK